MTPRQTVLIEPDTPPNPGNSSTPDTSPSQAVRDRIARRLTVPPWVLLVQVFIGLGWMRAAVEKIIDPNWWSGAMLEGFLESHEALTLPWYRIFLETVVEPNVLAISVTVVLAQVFAGVALLSGWKVMAGLGIGAFLNLNFVAAGATNPSIFYLVCEAAIVLWILQGESKVRKRPLRLLATASSALVLLNLPFISTLDPASVIEDPAMVLVTLGLLTALASRLGVRYSGQPVGRDLDPHWP